ncbi:protein mono-ADP-ribosyltransferase PARP9 [Rhinatrema bivittatum]|uniref:protein mono-ADP-ribosyltransferase PARP9 n=1 Tax=Rhinatrema bivittatum TaxID=194408 RepID=UPI001128E8DA|nr:protein mono-ADP-ribosyltransferase PARP9 [Rhinatrema bivittatum]XP_029461157.1 protein mono-ADP-ribosyltransferase PARP9 [Rhinatrema bivittatum]XP_029461158.1 protein mono-ADP-ribosyltransferase PARP9 [Rhinatrema bivittatum]XP_029461159.1 protein mono-ADP-ribosyltransferase PARP9 [Rhinatrema bivittatum]
MAYSKDSASYEAKSESGGFDRNEISVPIGDHVYQALLESENLLSDVVEKKFGCIGYLRGSVSLTTQTSTVHPMVVYRKTLRKELQLSVWKDDLTRHKADAVVNAANEHLDHAGGLALALVTAGGREIEIESKKWIDQHGKVETGEIAITTGGNLPCRKVIHAVGPIWQSSMEITCKQKLQAAVNSILKFVDGSSDIGSVAIPALSSGLFSFPLELCAATVVTTIMEFSKLAPASPHKKEIRLVNNDDRTVTAMKKACEEILGSSEDALSHPSPVLPSNQAFDSILVNGLRLQIIKGHIEDQQTMVIVNSTSETLDLKEGRISEAILKKAGPQLRHEFNSKRESRSQPRSIICTRGHNLSCQYVYHILWPKTADPKEKLQKVVTECLQLAQRFRTSSISFPALGTGAINIQKDLAAQIMTSKVLSFARQYPGKKPDVNFVIYPTDDETFKAFQHALEMSQKRPNYTENWSSFSDDEKRDHEPIGPAITICGKDSTNVSVAGAWIKDTLLPVQEHLLVEDKHIFYCGKREHEALSSGCAGVSIATILSNGCAKVEVIGLPRDVIKAVLHIEKMLCGVQAEHARKKEEELLQSAVQWSYAGTDRTNYGATVNCALEKACLAGKDVDVEVNGSFHTTSFRSNTVIDSKGQRFRLDRKCLLQHDYLQKKRAALMGSDLFYCKLPVELSSQEFQDRKREFEKANLQIIKMEKVQNVLLMALYQSRKDDVQRKHGNINVMHQLYQQVPAQFCDLVCRVGFQRVYAQPEEQKYGAGLYFHSNLRELMLGGKKPLEEDSLICIFQAEVVTGHYVMGDQSYIVPPTVGSDWMDLSDSVVNNTTVPETFVIFNSSQANPRYLFTCKQKGESSR